MMVDTRCGRDRIAHQRLIQSQVLCGKNLFWTAASHNLAVTLLWTSRDGDWGPAIFAGSEPARGVLAARRSWPRSGSPGDGGNDKPLPAGFRPHRLAHPFAAEVERQFVPAGPHCGRGIRQRSDALAALKRPFSQWLTRGVSASITPQISVIVGAGIGCIRLFAVSAGGSLADKWGTKRGNDVRHRTAHRLSRA